MNTEYSYKDLEKACSSLGLNLNDFVDNSDELQKGGDILDYKQMYLAQLKSNQYLLNVISDLKNNQDNRFENLEKGLNGVSEFLEQFSNSPLHSPKSLSGNNMQVMKKSFVDNSEISEEEKNARLVLDIKNISSIKRYLGGKQTEEFRKGIMDGPFAAACMVFDAQKTLPINIRKKIFEQDKVLIR